MLYKWECLPRGCDYIISQDRRFTTTIEGVRLSAILEALEAPVFLSVCWLVIWFVAWSVHDTFLCWHFMGSFMHKCSKAWTACSITAALHPHATCPALGKVQMLVILVSVQISSGVCQLASRCIRKCNVVEAIGFLGATKHLYNRLCPSVRRSERWSVGWSVCR